MSPQKYTELTLALATELARSPVIGKNSVQPKASKTTSDRQLEIDALLPARFFPITCFQIRISSF